MTSMVQVSRAEAAALTRLLAAPQYELIPLRGALDAAARVPAGATVTVTASPTKGMEPTIELVEELAARGFVAIPHLSARLTRNRAHLREMLRRLDAAGVTQAVVIGGDAKEAGDFPDALALLREMESLGHSIVNVSIAGYPEGHPFISDELLREALLAKAPFATSVTTQMTFDPEAIVDWARSIRAAGVELPLWLGLPGVAAVHKLARIAARIGIGQSIRYLTKQHGLLGKLARPGGYAPDELLTSLAPALLDRQLGVAGLHVFTFNQVATTEEWRQEMLAELDA